MMQALMGTSPVSECQKIINQTTHPLTTLMQLFLLHVKEEGTKVEFKEHCIHFMRPVYGQMVARMRDGVSYNDLEKLKTSVDEVVKMYLPSEYPEICQIFDLAILGLHTHRDSTYSGNPPAKIVIKKVIKAAQKKQKEYKTVKEDKDFAETTAEIKKIIKDSLIYLDQLDDESEEIKKAAASLRDFRKRSGLNIETTEEIEDVQMKLRALFETSQTKLKVKKSELKNSLKAKTLVKRVSEKFKEVSFELFKSDELIEKSETDESSDDSSSERFDQEPVEFFEGENLSEENLNPFREIWSKDELEEFLIKAEYVKRNFKDTSEKAKIIWQNKVKELETLIEGKIVLYRYVFTEHALTQT